MNLGFVGLMVVFALFIILLVVNPKLSCFGRRITSPLYPIFRKKHLKKRDEIRRAPAPEKGAGGKDKDRPTEDYGFKLD